MANINWRTINIDALDPDSPANFDLSSLTPAVAPVSTTDVQNLSQQIRQLLRGGDNEGALQGALENPPYGADDKGKVRCRYATSRAPSEAPLPSLSTATGRYHRLSLRIWPSCGHHRDRPSGLGLPMTRTGCRPLHSHIGRETRLTCFTAI